MTSWDPLTSHIGVWLSYTSYYGGFLSPESRCAVKYEKLCPTSSGKLWNSRLHLNKIQNFTRPNSPWTVKVDRYSRNLQIECRFCRQPNLCLNFAWNFALVIPTKFLNFTLKFPLGRPTNSWSSLQNSEVKFLNFPPKFGGTEATCAVKYEIATIRRAGWVSLLSSAQLMPEFRVEFRSCHHNKIPWISRWNSLLAGQEIQNFTRKFRGVRYSGRPRVQLNMKYLIFDEQVERCSCPQPNLCLTIAWNFALVTPTNSLNFEFKFPLGRLTNYWSSL